MNEYKPSLTRLARLAHKRPDLLASLIAAYQEQEGLDDTGLATFLDCPPGMLPRLALCRRPRQAPHFRQDVERIASYVQASPIKLARLIRAAESREALGQLSGAGPSLLLAARDREEREGSQDEPPDAS
jgi:hypothetical protein